jgi:hypothetical protein
VSAELKPELVEQCRKYILCEGGDGLVPPAELVKHLDGEIRRFSTHHLFEKILTDIECKAGWVAGEAAGVVAHVPVVYVGCSCGGCSGGLWWVPLPHRGLRGELSSTELRAIQTARFRLASAANEPAAEAFARLRRESNRRAAQFQEDAEAAAQRDRDRRAAAAARAYQA